jgi:hypothetical protein
MAEGRRLRGARATVAFARWVEPIGLGEKQMKKHSILGGFALSVLVVACSDAGGPTEAVTTTGSDPILQGTSNSTAVAEGYVFLAVPSKAVAGSGTLLTNEWVLTAAHVAEPAQGDPSQLFIALGNTTRAASEIHLHPLWNGDGEGQNPNVIDIALVKLAQPFSGGPYQRSISPLGTPTIIDDIHDARCFSYGPTNAANPQTGVFDGTQLLAPPFNTATFTFQNFPAYHSTQYRSNLGMVAFPTASGQITTKGDSGAGCVALTPDEHLYSVLVSGLRDECTSDADCPATNDKCNIPAGKSEGVCRVPKLSQFESAHSFRGFAEALMRVRTTTAHLTGPATADRVTLRLDPFGTFVLDIELEGQPLVTLPTGVNDIENLGTLAQLEAADFDGDGIDDILFAVEGRAVVTGESGRFSVLFSTRAFGGAWQSFLGPLIADVVAGTIDPPKAFPFFINSSFSFIQSVGMESTKPKGLRAVQTHGGTVEYFGSEQGLIQDLPPRGFDFDGDGLEDLAGSSRHQVEIVLGTQPDSQWISIGQADLGGDPATTSFGAIAWGDFDGSCSDPLEPCRHELVVASPREVVPGENPGAIYYVSYDGAQRELTRANLAGLPKSYPTFGNALAVGDFNDDGYDDVAVSHADHVPGTAVSIISGGPSGLTTSSPVETLSPGHFSMPAGFFGWALVAGDFNCDGVDDLAIGAPFTDQAFPDVHRAGAVVVVNGGGANLADAPFIRVDKDLLLPGHAKSDDLIGMSLAAGNFDGDREGEQACVDLAIGAPNEDYWDASSGGPVLGETGAVYIVRGSPTGLTDVGAQRLVQGSFGIHGSETEGNLFGENLAIGRVNEDRFDDLVVGNPFEDGGNGAVHVLLGSADGIASSGHGYYQQGDGEIPNGLLPDTADSGDGFGNGVGTLARGLVAVGADREDLDDFDGISHANTGHVSLIQFAENEELLIGQARDKTGAAVYTVGELAQDYFTRKTTGQSVEAFLASDAYVEAPFDALVDESLFGIHLTKARAPLGAPLFSKRTDLGRELNHSLLLQRGGLEFAKRPKSEPAPAPAAACYHAVQSLEVRDRATFSTTLAVAGNGFKALAKARVFADLELKGAASARDLAVLTGDVRVSGTLSLLNGANVEGTLSQNVPISVPALTSHTVTPGTLAVTVNGGQTRLLPPGAYGTVLVSTNGVLALGPGEYRFKSLTVEGELYANHSSGAIIVNVQQALLFRDRSRVRVEDPRMLRFNAATTGSIGIGTDAYFAGYLSAPGASFEVGSRSEIASCVAAKSLVFQPDARILGLR